VAHLGSLTGTIGASNQETAASSLPYGQTTLNPTNDAFPFTDHERDAENGSDATLYRHYSPAQGRWLSPDPYNGRPGPERSAELGGV
jgi:RHS repeat-associated protein